MSGPMNPHDDYEPRRTGMSGTAKVVIGVFVTLGILAVLCCGIFGASMFWFVRSAQNSVSLDPETIHRVTSEIVTIEIPPQLKPAQSVAWTAPANLVSFKFVRYADAKDDGGLMLMQFGSHAIDEATMRSQWKESANLTGRPDWEDVEIEESEKFESTIDGQPAQFTIGKGRDRKNNAEVWQVVGQFHGQGGIAMLVMKVDASEFSKDQITALLGSMK